MFAHSGFVIKVNNSAFNLDFMGQKFNLATSNICPCIRQKLSRMKMERELNENVISPGPGANPYAEQIKQQERPG